MLDELKSRISYRRLRGESGNALFMSALSLVVSVATLAFSVFFSWQTLEKSTEEFRISARTNEYTDIVAGLDSQAAAVQTNSMRRLTQYVEDKSNFESREEHATGVTNAIQTLTAFIEDQSSDPDFTGLHDYQSPQPIVVSRAINQLRVLTGNADLGSHSVDISRANLHGVPMAEFAPAGNLIAQGTDFRRASLASMDLSGVAADFEYAFFTCAGLGRADFGKANLMGADLSGANLEGADLSEVQNLTSDQLHGATTGPKTQLPDGVEVDPDDEWGLGSATCNTLVNNMTGMQAGWGYLSTHPCPTTLEVAEGMEFDTPFDGRLEDLVVACSIRAGLDPDTELPES